MEYLGEIMWETGPFHWWNFWFRLRHAYSTHALLPITDNFNPEPPEAHIGDRVYFTTRILSAFFLLPLVVISLVFRGSASKILDRV